MFTRPNESGLKPADIGTLWTMSRRNRLARCKLLAWPGRLQLLILVDREAIREQACADAEDAFALAERWKRDLRDRGWQQIVPGRPGKASAEQPPV